MAVSNTLRLGFVTQDGGTASLTLAGAKDTLTEAQIRIVAQDIIDKDIFTTSKGQSLTRIRSAYVDVLDRTVFIDANNA